MFVHIADIPVVRKQGSKETQCSRGDATMQPILTQQSLCYRKHDFSHHGTDDSVGPGHLSETGRYPIQNGSASKIYIFATFHRAIRRFKG